MRDIIFDLASATILKEIEAMPAASLAARNLVSPTVLAAEQIKSYKEEGYVLLRGLLAPADAKAMHDEVLSIMDKIGLPLTSLKQSMDYLEGGAIDGLVNSPHLLALAAQLMEGPSTLYMPFTAVKSGGGGGRFHFHQDNQYTRFDGPGLNMWCALQPMSLRNGCLQFVPKSHLAGTLDSIESADKGHRRIKWDPSDFVSIDMQPGDCVAFSRLTIHGSCPNQTPEPRVGYAVQFHRDDVTARREDGSWKSLKQFPRYRTGPVKEITVPKGKLEGH